MEYNVDDRQNAVVLALEGNILGGPDGTRLHDTLRQLKEQGKKNVVVDLSKAAFMSSSGLGMLISAMTTMRNAGGDVRLASSPDKIQQLIRLTKLDSVFQQYSNVDEAVVSYTT